MTKNGGIESRQIIKRQLVRLLQEAQLSQTGRASLHVVENFAESLKVTRGHLKPIPFSLGVCKFLLLFHGNSVSVLYCC